MKSPMSEARHIDQEQDDGELDTLSLAALLSSRVCHDLINPVGAIESGLDVLDDPDMDDSMRAAALDLVKSGARKAVALLSFARLAYGAGGAYGEEVGLEDARKALSDVFDIMKPDLDWRLGAGSAAKEKVKVMLILAHAAADCVPRGGSVVVESDGAGFKISASGKRLMLQEDLRKALAGDARGLAPKFTPTLIASQIVAAAGGGVSAEMTDDAVTIRAEFSR